MTMPSRAIVRATLSADGRLLSADALLLTLQQEAGADLGEAFAVPQLVAIARLAARLGVLVSRPVVAAAQRGDIDMWVRAKPDDQGVSLSIVDWRERPSAPTLPDDGRRDADIAALADGWTWQIDTQLRFQMVLAGGGDSGALPANPPVPGARFSSYFQLEADSDGDMAMLRGFAQRRAFRDQQAILASDGEQRFRLSAFPMFDHAGQLTGYRGTAFPLEKAVVAPLADEAPLSIYPAEFGRRLDRSLRQPLGRIIANADTISAQLEGPLRPDYAGYANDIAAAGRHLMALVDDLADLQAIDRPDFSVISEEVDLADLGRRAAGLLTVKALDRRITIVAPPADASLLAIGEFRRILQILVNLIGNAVRYSPEGTEVRVATEWENGQARIAVIDQGAGVAQTDRERIFEKFERLGRDDASGSGLGLYISRRLARAMKGDIRIGGAPGEGARFILSLPVGN
ncbi:MULTISPECIES: sensor histidine kinase [Sphingobium]|jgi:signal transduction histidine kinase|uniref:sensor histidine kinase n=1 Tax=Sphingobium TaxID=165695 RepID=UPI000E716FEF|nr:MULTISPECIES: HAMP domain-containing sensor histidine kinase [Sphingobium]KAA9017919.1 HAMP domain-containing histidine kinase [Sphingobium limneticum]MBU0932548.1 HAMP domain-containing histidine kinase [Alphaproteobacteria bacterium]